MAAFRAVELQCLTLPFNLLVLAGSRPGQRVRDQHPDPPHLGNRQRGSPQTDPFNIAVTSSAVYVTDQGADTLTVINPKALTVAATVTVGNRPYGVAVDP
jgi:YVTN family beta-propeller protein